MPPESTARTSKTPRQARRARPSQGIVEANRKTEICKHWLQLQGACPFGAKCAFAHGAHELRRLPESHNAAGKMMKASNGLQDENETPSGARVSSCYDPRCMVHHGSCASLTTDNSTQVHRPSPRRGDGSNGNGMNMSMNLVTNHEDGGGGGWGRRDSRDQNKTVGGGVNRNAGSSSRTGTGTTGNGILQAWSMPSSSAGGHTGTSQRSPLQELDANAQGPVEHGTLLPSWQCPGAILQSSSLGWTGPTGGGENGTTGIDGAGQPSAFHKVTSNGIPTTTNSGSGYSAASSAGAATVLRESETWANVVARRSSRRGFSACAAPSSSTSPPLPLPLPLNLPRHEGHGVSPAAAAASSSSSSSPSSISASSACGRSDCPCCVAHAAAVAAAIAAAATAPAPAAPATFFGRIRSGEVSTPLRASAGSAPAPAAATTSALPSPSPASGSAFVTPSSSSSSAASAPASRWSSTATARSLFCGAPPAAAQAVGARLAEAPAMPPRPSRTNPSSCGEDSNQAVARMMAALSLNPGGDDDDDEEEEEEEELVGLSTKPEPWDVLPSFLLAEKEEEDDGQEEYGLGTSGTLGRRRQSSRLGNSYRSLSTQSSSDHGAGDAGTRPLPGLRGQVMNITAPSWTASPDELWQPLPHLPDAASNLKDGLFQVITPIPGFDFGWGLDSSEQPSSPPAAMAATGMAAQHVW